MRRAALTVLVGPAAVLTALVALATVPPPATAAAPAVSVFPTPGSSYNRPQTQITFRGIPAAQIGQVQVTGSSTGVHTGHIAADSDGQGGSFLPDKPFSGGETVTVSTQLNILGGTNGAFMFKIANALPLLSYGALPPASNGPGAVQQFRSRPDLKPASIVVTKDSAPAAGGDMFLTPQYGPLQDGPMILDPRGNLLWFLPFPVNTHTMVANLQVQRLFDQPVLTWWQGNSNLGLGRGVGMIYNQNYQQIATVDAANGMDMDLHEFLVTPGGDAYFFAASPVQLPGIHKPTIDMVIQEVDIQTGLVLFEWHALDHVPVSRSYFVPKTSGLIFDPYHANSIALDSDGNLVVSMRNTSAIYKIDHQSGRVIWTLGGKRSSFKLGRGVSTWGQHDAAVQPDGTITVFDDGAGPPTVHPFSRGIRIGLDTKNMTASLIKQYGHSPAVSANFEGSVQPLPDGDVFLGWGQQPYFSEDSASGQQDFDAHFVVPADSYRAYRFPWSAQPPTTPALALWAGGGGAIHLDASWNGATDVSSWRALGGASPSALAPVGGAGWRGFETDVSVHQALPYFAVQAIGSRGQVLATSTTRATGPHLAVFGGSAFVGGVIGGIPAFCYLPTPCHISTTVYAGRTLISRTGREFLPSGRGGILYFRLNGAGGSILAHKRRVAVHVTATDASRVSAATDMTLVPFHTSGSGPHRTLSNSATLRIVGGTDFVNSAGVGGLLASCVQNTACHVTTTVSAGGSVIARTGPEFIGANEFSYLIFNLTGRGRALLARARGNQLRASVTVSDGGATATGTLALVRFK